MTPSPEDQQEGRNHHEGGEEDCSCQEIKKKFGQLLSNNDIIPEAGRVYLGTMADGVLFVNVVVVAIYGRMKAFSCFLHFLLLVACGFDFFVFGIN
mmetsp:Transcript_6948/g.13111  ORF Transcript_6948/g.13111 Transcript_6948/m.13111 type:complete len:96 (-) Transcript_6948:2037-2324(-)